MREVINRLEHLGFINRDIRLAIAVHSPTCDQLSTLRADFSYECSLLLNQLTAKLSSHEHARTAWQLIDLFVVMHRTLAAHQQRWTVREIKQAPESYLAEAQLIHSQIINFIEQGLDYARASIAPLPQPEFAPSLTVRLTGTH